MSAETITVSRALFNDMMAGLYDAADELQWTCENLPCGEDLTEAQEKYDAVCKTIAQAQSLADLPERITDDHVPQTQP